MNISATDITYPTLSIEMIAIAYQSIGLLLLFSVSSLKLRDYLQKPTSARLICSCIGFSYAICQLLVLLAAFPLEYPIVYAIEHWILFPTTLAYCMFQIMVLGSIAGTLMGNWQNTIIYSLYSFTILVFLVCVPSKMNPDTDITGFWNAWSKLIFLWEAYIVVLDIGLNVVLIRVLFNSSLFGENAQGQPTKRFFLTLCLVVIAFDVLAGILGLKIASVSYGEETLVRTSHAYSLILSASSCVHVAAGLFFLTGLISYQRSAMSATSLKANVNFGSSSNGTLGHGNSAANATFV